MAEEAPKMYGATSAGEHEAALSAPDTPVAAAPAKSWVRRASVSLGLLGLAGVAYSVGGGAVASSSDLRAYLDDDLFSGHVKVWSDDKKIIRKADNASHLSCGDWDDDTIYPTGKCITGDATQCTYLTNYSAFNTLCDTACNVTNSTWGVPCAWEVISHLDEACETVATGKQIFNWTYPDASGDITPDYYKEYEYNVKDGYDYMPYAFNSSMDSSEWDDCNTHAFCYSCTTEEAEVNEFCKYMVSKYDTVYAASAFFKNFDYWCGKVQLIESGGFQDVLTSCADEPNSEGCDGWQALLDFKDSFAPTH